MASYACLPLCKEIFEAMSRLLYLSPSDLLLDLVHHEGDVTLALWGVRRYSPAVQSVELVIR